MDNSYLETCKSHSIYIDSRGYFIAAFLSICSCTANVNFDILLLLICTHSHTDYLHTEPGLTVFLHSAGDYAGVETIVVDLSAVADIDSTVVQVTQLAGH
jgi:hypothetical protein